MKLLLVSPMQAWFCIVVSIAAMFILGVLAALFSIKHESLVGGTEDPPPESAPEIVWNIIMAIVVYACFLICCCGQVLLGRRGHARGEIALQSNPFFARKATRGVEEWELDALCPRSDRHHMYTAPLPRESLGPSFRKCPQQPHPPPSPHNYLPSMHSCVPPSSTSSHMAVSSVGASEVAPYAENYEMDPPDGAYEEVPAVETSQMETLPGEAFIGRLMYEQIINHRPASQPTVDTDISTAVLGSSSSESTHLTVPSAPSLPELAPLPIGPDPLSNTYHTVGSPLFSPFGPPPLSEPFSPPDSPPLATQHGDDTGPAHFDWFPFTMEPITARNDDPHMRSSET